MWHSPVGTGSCLLPSAGCSRLPAISMRSVSSTRPVKEGKGASVQLHHCNPFTGLSSWGSVGGFANSWDTPCCEEFCILISDYAERFVLASFGLCIWNCSKPEVISSRAECNLHSPRCPRDACFVVWGVGGGWKFTLLFGWGCCQRHPCPPAALLLLAFKAGPWPLHVWPQRSEIWLQWSWGTEAKVWIREVQLDVLLPYVLYGGETVLP